MDIDCGGCDGCDCGGCDGCGDCGHCDCGDCAGDCCQMFIWSSGPDCNCCSLATFLRILFWGAIGWGVFALATCERPKTAKEIKQEVAATVHTGVIVDTYWTLRVFAEDSTTVVEDANKHRYLLKGKRGKKGDEITFTEGETIK